MSAPNTPKTPDPVLTHSLSWPLAIAALALMASTLWAMYDEVWVKRPWWDYQNKFVAVYGQYLDSISADRANAEAQIFARDDYKALKEQAEALEKENDPKIEALKNDLAYTIQPRIDDLTKAMGDPKALIAAQVYLIEKASAEDNQALKGELQAHLKELETRPNEFQWRKTPIPASPEAGAVTFETQTMSFQEINSALEAAKAQKTENLAKQAEFSAPASAVRKQMQAIEDLYKTGLSTTELAAIKEDLGKFTTEIKQIHVKDVDLVDRCESCHVGIRKPVPMTKEALLPIVNNDTSLAAVFAVHPKEQAELLKIHDPERFGCSPCHGGNGIGTTTIEKAHGLNHHWLWPLHEKENTEAGCLQCHQSELRLEHSTTLNAGKELFRHLGCWGCHPRDGFQIQKNDLLKVKQDLTEIDNTRAKLLKAIDDNQAKLTTLESPEQVKKMVPILAKERDQITLQISSLKAQEEALLEQRAGLYLEAKKVGPNLKNIKAKLNRDWVPAWITQPKSFRPDTRMPQFRFDDPETVKDIAAFIWQSGNAEMAPKQTPGDATAGQELFEKRGCLGCHSVGEGAARHGGEFAANLSRVGEKANYDYLVHWVQHPDRRLVPYNQSELRDYTAEEAKTIPASDPAWQQAVIMPNLRLSDEEARNIASYLLTLKHADATYAVADYMEDKARFDRGKDWVKHYGCAGCHEIAGLEKEGGIGTDLTKEGSKPIERLDFGLLTLTAELGKSFENDPFEKDFKGPNGEEKEHEWYNHKGFFQRKLAQPEVFDYKKHDTKAPKEKLKMPNFGLSEEQNVQLTTFLLGSVDSNLPPRYYYQPEGQAKDIADGWWIVQKYNCVGCHQFVPGETPQIQNLPQFSGENKGMAPPNLVGEGARVDPQWLAGFLRNPALSTERQHRNGVRQYLQVRMPTFSLSEREIQTLVRFFNALAKQPTPYVRPTFSPLTAEEKTLARAVLRENCTRCHAAGDMEVFPKEIIAPNLGYAPARLKPAWVERWVIQPTAILPGTNMPDGLFQYNETVKRFTIPSQVPGLDKYTGDHRDLLVHYLMEMDSAEAELLRTGK